MLQFVLTLLPVLLLTAAFAALACRVKFIGTTLEQMLSDFGWMIESSPAQVAFFMFSVTAAIAASLAVCVFSLVSRQLILSLDILFLLSSMLLILFHQLKEHSPASL